MYCIRAHESKDRNWGCPPGISASQYGTKVGVMNWIKHDLKDTTEEMFISLPLLSSELSATIFAIYCTRACWKLKLFVFNC